MKNNLNKTEALVALKKHGYNAEIKDDVLMIYCGIKNAKKMLKTVRNIGYLGSLCIDEERKDVADT